MKKSKRYPYGRWLVRVRQCFRSISQDVRPCSDSWRHWYDSDYTPVAAVQEDLGIQLPYNPYQL